MADKALSTLTETTALTDADLLYTVDGSNSRKISAANAKKYLAGWTEVGGYDFSIDGAVSQVDIVGLAGYSEFLIIGDGLSLSSSGNIQLRVSVNNGSSFYAGVGDYKTLSTDGTDGADTSVISFSGSSSTTARAIAFRVLAGGFSASIGWNEAVPKGSVGPRRFSASASAINALRVTSSAGNINGGAFTVLAR